ncbi:EamA family transporter [Delftia sp. PS-11]|uniref:EamA family transporter n=1 Tax=Delftia sp. PS-11 TaxID=2767222 RepID=UPI002454B362|nr:EamA family transporter [Delftia sp. PS-11]KAJ8743533.1 EamA family transporter [Delftia sp. PS-11]
MSAPHLSRGDWARALLVIVIWGTNFVAMKFGLQTLSPMLLSALRFVAASLPFLLFVRPPRSVGWRYLAAYGVVQGVGQFGLLFLGLKLGMPAGMASVVLQTQAFVTLLLAAFFLNEPARLWHWLGLVVSLCGLMAIGSAHGEGSDAMTLAGFLLTVGSACMWAVSNLITRYAARSGPYEPFAFIVWSSVFPIAPLLALAVWTDGVDTVVRQLQGIDLTAIAAILYLALLATLLGYGLWTRLLQRYSAGTVAPLSLMVPVVGLLSAMLLLGERPTPMQWLGTLAVLAGMCINQFGGRWLATGRR